MLTDEIRLRILRELEREPKLSQRDLAHVLGVSIGKTNYCLRALVDKGFVKVENFRKSGNKLAYAYQLTPRGITDKVKLTRAYLKIKQSEYDSIRSEITELEKELALSNGENSEELGRP
jgi:EPS-associated MarR family transcriptional regulator